jgi:hypothetical protein
MNLIFWDQKLKKLDSWETQLQTSRLTPIPGSRKLINRHLDTKIADSFKSQQCQRFEKCPLYLKSAKNIWDLTCLDKYHVYIHIQEKQNRDCSIKDISLFQRIFLSPADFSLYMNLCIEMNMRKSAYVMSGYFFCPADFSLHMNLFIEMNIRKKLNEFKTVDRIKCIYNGQADISFL